MSRMWIWFAGLVLVVATLPPPASAQVSKDEIVRSLKPATTRGLTRSIGAPKTRQIEIIPGKEAEVLDKPELPKINLRIEFEYNSDHPTAEGEKQLAALGQALMDPALKPFKFLVAGHTDARGSDGYNMDLSVRRAAAVQVFLGKFYGIEPARLHATGFGKTRLLKDVPPDDGRNRRVEVVTLAN